MIQQSTARPSAKGAILMTRLIAALALALGLTTSFVPASAVVQASAVSRHGMHVSVLPKIGPRTIRPGGIISFYLRVRGIHLVPRFGTHPITGAGHLQLYLDGIPTDAYRRADLQHHWLASVAATTFRLRFPLAIVDGRRGHHTVLIALAEANNVLYRVPASRVTITVR
jgi:hypothetical protein